MNWTEAVTEEARPSPTYIRIMDAIEAASGTDKLTGLPTLLRLKLDLADKIRELGRYSNRRYALVMLDLNGFKTVNDTYGHSCGDEAIRIFAKQLSVIGRGEDKAYRRNPNASDEFYLLVEYGEANEKNEELSIEDRTVLMISRLFRQIKSAIDRYDCGDMWEWIVRGVGNEPIEIEGGIPMYASWGVVELGKGSAVEDVLAEVDDLMYQHKKSLKKAERN